MNSTSFFEPDDNNCCSCLVNPNSPSFAVSYAAPRVVNYCLSLRRPNLTAIDIMQYRRNINAVGHRPAAEVRLACVIVPVLPDWILPTTVNKYAWSIPMVEHVVNDANLRGTVCIYHTKAVAVTLKKIAFD